MNKLTVAAVAHVAVFLICSCGGNPPVPGPGPSPGPEPVPVTKFEVVGKFLTVKGEVKPVSVMKVGEVRAVVKLAVSNLEK